MYKITEYINFNSGYMTFGFTAGRYERRSARGGKIYNKYKFYAGV